MPVVNEQRATSRFVTTPGVRAYLEILLFLQNYCYYYYYRAAAPQPCQELIALAATGEEFVFGCDAIVELHASIKRWKQI